MNLKLILFTIVLVFILSSCGNKQLIDTTYTFDRAIIELPNGEIIDGEVQSWKDFEDGDQIQVKINDKTYLVHSSKIVLIAE
ncbi:MAG: hypothetical protein A2Y15_06810 [Clostridiales bacterium GWF2_36_10]|nr:MAG: hypothetical protein A2Y15_06810 [Clostridiales bacterium GWF2_36_10]HAN20358.1 hypothetical protein [Clostridiales bacterium]